VMSGSVEISASSGVEIDALLYLIQVLGYTGTLASGDVMIIDCDELTITKNGTNVRKDFTGIFTMLGTGTNKMEWDDDEASRTLELSVAHSPRYL